MSQTSYHFFPCLRSGLAAGIEGSPRDGASRAEVNVWLEVTRREMASGRSVPEEVPGNQPTEEGSGNGPTQKVQLCGPGDVLGFDERMVVRTDPGPNSGNFEPNYFPAVEFAEPDFPWRFSPKAGEPKGLVPWVTLIVLIREDRGEDVSEFTYVRVPRRRVPLIQVHRRRDLPNLANAWMWAHVQATCAEDQFENEEGTGEPEEVSPGSRRKSGA